MRKNYFFFVNDNIYIDIIIFNSCFFLRLALYQLNRFNVISTNVKKAIQKVRWHSDEKADYSDSSFLKHLCVHSFRYINSSLPHLPYFLFFTSLPPAKRKKKRDIVRIGVEILCFGKLLQNQFQFGNLLIRLC